MLDLAPALGFVSAASSAYTFEMVKAWWRSGGVSYLVVRDVMNGCLAFGALASCTFTLFLGGRLEKGWVRSVNESEERDLQREAVHLRWQSTRSKPCALQGVEGP
jgi:hypothetical protein